MNTQRRDKEWYYSRYPQAIMLIGCDTIHSHSAQHAPFIFGRYEKLFFFLALGTFGLGMAEFGIMGVLTSWHARCRDNDSRRRAYDIRLRLSASLGAPVMALFSSRFSLAKHILLFLVTLCVMGNAILPFPRHTRCSPSVTGFRLPHRRLFGVGAIVLSKIIRPESHRRRASPRTTR